MKTRRKKRRGAVFALLSALVIFAAAACLYLAGPGGGGGAAPQDGGWTLAKASLGDVTHTVYGAGVIEPVSQPGVYAAVDGHVAKTRVSMGDPVKAGDILMDLEDPALDAEIGQLEYDLAQAQLTVEHEKTYESMRYEQLYWPDGSMRYDVDTGEPLQAEYSNELSIRAPGAGRIVAIYIEPGDDALAVYREKGAVMLISTDGKSRIEIKDAPAGLLALGDIVRVQGEGIDTTGVVENTARRATQATIVIEGDTHLLGLSVSVSTQDGQAAGSGVIEANKPLAVSAYGGIIRTVGARVGQMVKDDEPLARFVHASIPLHIDNATVLKDYAVAKTALDEAVARRNALTVVAPCDGRVVSVDAAAGTDVVSGDLLLTLVEDAGMQIILTIDELDIVHVRQGQRVSVSVDALEDVTVSGTVQKIAPIGDTESAVTTYDVYVLADEVDARVLGGMNVSGEIEIESIHDALLIPTDALQKDAQGYFVALEDGEIRRVTTGVVTAERAQILSGLAAGETVKY